MIKITDVRACPSDSAFLIDDGEAAVLIDTGFAFTGERVADNITNTLGDRELDYIFLTHSHYDHALGAPYVKERYPNAKVVAGEYAARIFSKESARATMRELDRKFAVISGVSEYRDLIDDLSVDITVSDGDIITAGQMDFIACAFPGHTKCSFGFYLKERKLLVASETIGIYDGDKAILPSFLAGYEMTLSSIRRAASMDIDNILLAHFGVLDRVHTKYFLSNAENAARESAEEILAILSSGKTKEDAVKYIKDKFYHGRIKEVYPPDAMELNTSISVALVEKELLATE